MSVVSFGGSRRSRPAARGLLAAAVVALAGAGCASEGTVSGQGLPSGLTGSPTALASASGQTPGQASATDSSTGQDQGTSASTSESVPAFSAPDSSTSSSAAGKVYKLTDVVTEGGFKLKIHSITLPYNPPPGSDFAPGTNRAWLRVDFEATNVSGQQLMFSTLGAFDLRDGTNHSYVTSTAAELSMPKGQAFQDQEMAPNASATGAVVFDVPQTGTGYRLIYRGNMWQDAGDNPPSIMLGR